MQTKFGKFHMPFAIAFAAIAVILLLFFCFQSWQEANELGKQKPHAHVQTHTADRRVLFISSLYCLTIFSRRCGSLQIQS